MSTTDTPVAGQPNVVAAFRTPRSAGIAGVAFSVLFTIGFVYIHHVLPSDPADAGVWLTDSTHRSVGLVVLALMPFACIAFLWFIGVLRSRVGDREDRFFATVFLGSGLVFAALFLVWASISSGMIESVDGDRRPIVDSDVWSTMWHVATAVGVSALTMAGVFAAATSTILLRSAAVPRALAAFGTVVAALMVLDGERVVAWIGLLFPAWVLALSVYVLVVSFTRDEQSWLPPT